MVENERRSLGRQITMLKPADEKIIKISKEIYLVCVCGFGASQVAQTRSSAVQTCPALPFLVPDDCGFIFQLNVISRVDYKCFLVCCNGSQQRALQREQHRVQSTINFFRLARCP